MLKRAFCNTCTNSVLVHGVDASGHGVFVPTCNIHSKNPNKHVSFKQCTIGYMEPFTLDVFISKHLISASLTNRSCASKSLWRITLLKSRPNIPLRLAVGGILADRVIEANVGTASYTPRERDKFEGEIRASSVSLIDSVIDINVYLD
ncbi:hypothetical protein ACJRO7_020167 [Eucalyptus globulus]|uniref:Uncharacterized protein n=1 Tax=Eucalyptus globulus TaxID=34317 RepID=A0ABD3KHE8_EUCGL